MTSSAVAARSVRANHVRAVRVQAEPGAPPSSGVVGWAYRPLHLDGRLRELAEADEGIVEHLRLERALVSWRDVSELGATWAYARLGVQIGLGPHVCLAVFGRLKHADNIRPPERLLPFVRDASQNPLTWNRVGNEHDAPFMPGDEYAAVSNVGDRKF